MTPAPADRSGGFILVETIVAFAVLALALGVAMQTISQSARTIGRAAEVQAANLAWRSLAAEEFPKLLDEGVFEGTLDDVIPWRMTARAVRDSRARPLLSVSARIWPRGATGPSFVYQTFVSNPVEETP